MTTFIQTHWVQILAALSTSYAAIVELFSRISAALPAPTAQSTPRYIFWFQFANNLARNPERAKNLARIEDSPNFIPAAEAYYQKKLAESNKPVA
jgi:hypothetical protein